MEAPEYDPYSSRLVRTSILLLFLIYLFVVIEMVGLGILEPFLWVFVPDVIHMVDEATSLLAIARRRRR